MSLNLQQIKNSFGGNNPKVNNVFDFVSLMDKVDNLLKYRKLAQNKLAATLKLKNAPIGRSEVFLRQISEADLTINQLITFVTAFNLQTQQLPLNRSHFNQCARRREKLLKTISSVRAKPKARKPRRKRNNLVDFFRGLNETEAELPSVEPIQNSQSAQLGQRTQLYLTISQPSAFSAVASNSNRPQNPVISQLQSRLQSQIQSFLDFCEDEQDENPMHFIDSNPLNFIDSNPLNFIKSEPLKFDEQTMHFIDKDEMRDYKPPKIDSDLDFLNKTYIIIDLY